MRISIAIVLFVSAASAQNMVYPLNVGDRWQYFNVDPLIPFYHLQFDVLTDTAMPNRQHYAMVALTRSGKRIDSLSEFCRQEGNRVFRYSTVLNQEHLMYDFSRSLHDTAGTYVTGHDTIDVFLSPDTLLVVQGKLRRLRHAYHVIRHNNGPWTEIAIVDSIGAYYYWYPNERLSFQSASISGRVYGTVVSAPRYEASNLGSVRLDQNYPNPFNGSTRISFYLPSNSFVTLDVYDLLGGRVRNITQGFMTTGEHQLAFDARGLGSGSYFCRLSAGTTLITRAMILLK